ncbi:hypothetical protein BV898_08572 [Hypsibius exemplaris]|uniref:G-protein coupled receptors family 1 profile domain-containing protein n=1 Tax=Hypsibius exemplaris TaxID=2072580 RepID=A0A1W0WQ93_HYPEX|nr:hypothetical protein BV898_08572 [Hypsibius exemplaris]
MSENSSEIPVNGTADPAGPSNVEITAWMAVSVLLCALGAYTNLMALIATWPRSADNCSLNLLVFHLVAANILTLLVNIPVKVIMVHVKVTLRCLLPEEICSYVNGFYIGGWFLIYWTDAALAVNRCFALYLPRHYMKHWTASMNRRLIPVIWLLSAACVIPTSLGYGGTMQMLSLGQCALRSANSAAGTFFKLAPYIPLTITGVCSVLLLFKTCPRSRTVVVIDVRNWVARDGVRRLKMAKTLLVTFMWNAVFNIAFGVFNFKFAHIHRDNPFAGLWLQPCMALQCAVTPCILLHFNAGYRRRLANFRWRSTIISYAPRPANTATGHSARRSKVSRSLSYAVNAVGHEEFSMSVISPTPERRHEGRTKCGIAESLTNNCRYI